MHILKAILFQRDKLVLSITALLVKCYLLNTLCNIFTATNCLNCVSFIEINLSFWDLKKTSGCSKSHLQQWKLFLWDVRACARAHPPTHTHTVVQWGMTSECVQDIEMFNRLCSAYWFLPYGRFVLWVRDASAAFEAIVLFLFRAHLLEKCVRVRATVSIAV